MAARVFVGGRRIAVNPAASLGKGGEADVYDIGGGKALKLFKTPDHPDVAGDAVQEAAARARLAEAQVKLPAFPADLPARVVRPESLAVDRSGRIVGYVMRRIAGAAPLMELASPGRLASGPTSQDVVSVLRDLHLTLGELHARGVVVGDANDLNVLVAGAAAELIDADSFQFGSFPSRMYTESFLDPLRCDAASGRLEPVRPASPDSDWYAFAVMLLETLLFVLPYGGVYRPSDPARRVAHGARPLHRLTVFHPDVRYPKPARRPDVLPDDLMGYLMDVFAKDRRGPFPAALLDRLRFTRCGTCGLEHGRSLCPGCAAAAPAAVSQVVDVRGQVTCTRVHASRGRLLHVALRGSRLFWLEEVEGAARREDGREVFRGNVRAGARVELGEGVTAVSHVGRLVTFTAGAPPVDRATDPAALAAGLSDQHAYWLEGGILWRDGPFGAERVGDVLQGQTAIWVGPRSGFGLSRAGDLCVAFVFGDGSRALYDGVAIPRIRGQLVAAHAAFGGDRTWFLTASREGGREIRRCAVIDPGGSVIATGEAAAGDGSWLEAPWGAGAAGRALFVPTDEGILRVEESAGRLAVTRRFPDTEPFVHAGCQLLPGADGIYVVDGGEVRHLRMG